jgi:hypothetical protein
MQELNDYHFNEAMDRVYIAATMIEDYLSEHPAIFSIDREESVQRVIETLQMLYQELGEKAAKE